jgi:hypothetical protein
MADTPFGDAIHIFPNREEFYRENPSALEGWNLKYEVGTSPMGEDLSRVREGKKVRWLAIFCSPGPDVESEDEDPMGIITCYDQVTGTVYVLSEKIRESAAHLRFGIHPS